MVHSRNLIHIVIPSASSARRDYLDIFKEKKQYKNVKLKL
jgi:hypothetical protein